ncbi:MAG: exosortase/archaeosortase family protein [Candidatus Bathyarchaeia archaeon]
MRKLEELFREAFAKIKAYYAHGLALFLVVLLVFVVYRHDLEILVNEALNSEALSHLLLMPFFVSLLFYMKRDSFKASLALEKLQKRDRRRYVDELIGLSLCLIAFILYWYGSYSFYSLEYHLLSLPIFVIGVTLILFNMKALRVLIFPILFLLFLVPLPNETMYTLGGFLANINTQASYALLKLFGVPVTLTTSYASPTLTLPSQSGKQAAFTIDLPCSGIYTLIAFAMFAAFLAFVISAPAWKKFVIFLLGFFVFEILNILRITTILSIAYLFGEEIAMTLFHTVAGLVLTFAGMLLTLFVSEKFLKIKVFPKTRRARLCPQCKNALRSFQNFCLNCGKFFNPLRKAPSTIFWAKLILLLLVCSAIAVSINAPAFAIAQGTVEVTSGWESSLNIFPQMPEYDLKFLYRDFNYERIAKQDASLVYGYFPMNFSNPTVYVVIGVASSLSNLHSWEVCLISWQTAQGQFPLVSVLDSRDVELLPEIPLIARFLVFKNSQNYTQTTLYWYEKALFKTGVTIQQKYVRISLISFSSSEQSYRQQEETLLVFGESIAKHWEPLKQQSLVSIGVPLLQFLLAATILFATVLETGYYLNEARKRQNNLRIFQNYASQEDKLMLQTVQKLSQESKEATFKVILQDFQKSTGEKISPEKALGILNGLENYGLIRKDLAVRHNIPKLVWKF